MDLAWVMRAEATGYGLLHDQATGQACDGALFELIVKTSEYCHSADD
jgi:hypothetical protein